MLECKCWTAGGGGVALGPTALGAVVAGDIAANAVTELTGTGTGA